MTTSYTFARGNSPIVAAAIHDGHYTREELHDLFNLADGERLREEDPFTGEWVGISDNNIIVHHSRFEADVNRPREKAIYRTPEDAWNLKVWKEELPDPVVNASLAVYDKFYEEARKYFDSLFLVHEKIVVYDIHSYNHRREAADKEADPSGNPEINIGTKNMDRKLWQPLVQVMMECFQQFDYAGRHLDVRENVKFKGGYFGEWLYEQYGKKICPVSIEFKKFFMDEWTGKPFQDHIGIVKEMLHSSKAPVLKALEKI